MKPSSIYKISLIHYGVCLSKEAEDSLKKGKDGNVKATDYVTTSGLLLRLDKDTYVTADIKPQSPFTLAFSNGAYSILQAGKQPKLILEVIQPPQFSLDNANISSIVAIHADRVRLSPIEGCAFKCSYCSANEASYFLKPLVSLDAALSYALTFPQVKHMLISGGTAKNRQEDYDYLSNVYEYMGKKYGSTYPIDVMMFPRGESVGKTSNADYLDYLKKLKSWNISGLSINLELWSDEARNKYTPQKSAFPVQKFLGFLQLAVEVFGSDNVRSSLIVGLESEEATLTAVKEMCKIGCMPMLSPYIPYGEVQASPSVEFMERVLIKADKIAEEYGMVLGPTCTPCRHNVLHTGRDR